jgi:hypothetical protein
VGVGVRVEDALDEFGDDRTDDAEDGSVREGGPERNRGREFSEGTCETAISAGASASAAVLTERLMR